VVPKPVQKPHPPIRIAANSPETAVFAGKTGYPIFVASVTNPLPKMFEQVATYRRSWTEQSAPQNGTASAKQDVSTMFFVHPGENLDYVRKTVEPSIDNYFQSVLGMMTSGSSTQDDVESYRYTAELRKNLESITFEKVVRSMAIFGSSRECIERISALHKELRMNELICWFNPGGLVPHDKVLAAMTRFANEVIPEVQDL
jgi:alkanesulfonate monooxygenase SsuD/methylene tetrahydromethanopterin reductase-like flavin-dependent oxidoreductase (luciferase family)